MTTQLKRTMVVAIAMTVVVSALYASTGAAENLTSWFHANEEMPAKDWIHVPCGELGDYYFSDGSRTFPEGDIVSQGVESLPSYHVPSSGPPSIGPPPKPNGPEDVWAIDFNNSHGWAVAAAIQQFAGPEVAVAMSYVDATEVYSTVGANDAAVLETLCEVFVNAEQYSHMPRVVSMSFGRLATHSGESLATAKDLACHALGARQLSCEIREVVDALNDHGVAVVAAAGNYQDVPQFPAVYQPVMSVGALDSSRFQDDYGVVPSWESPSNADVLLPGAGICLESQGAFLNPGSSYATALAAGAIAAASGLNAAGSLEHCQIHPVRCGTNYCLEATTLNGCFLIQNFPLSRVMKRIRGIGVVSECSNPSASNGLLDEAFELNGLDNDPRPPGSSLLEAVAALNIPAPGSDRCVPCIGQVVNQGGGTGGKSLTLGTNDGLVVDLSEVAYSEQSTAALSAVYLRIGDQFYVPDFSWYEIQQLNRGTLQQLVLGGIEVEADSASLILRYTVSSPECGANPSCDYWTAAPLLIIQPSSTTLPIGVDEE